MSDTSIEWTDKTWNPIRGCSRVSAGCQQCYAEKIAARFSGPGQPFEGFAKRSPHRWTSRVELIPDAVDAPLRWRKPARIFVNSMSDLFHEALPDEAIDRVVAVMMLAPRHTFQILTKRPARMAEYFKAPNLYERVLRWANVVRAERPKDRLGDIGISNPADAAFRPWIWLGVSVEDQATADERIPLLLQTPAAVRFVSYEPALTPVSFSEFQPFCWKPIEPSVREHLRSIYPNGLPANSLNAVYEQMKVDWLIVGGESGPSARPFDIGWMRSAVWQCRASDVAVFCKQWGSRPFHGANDDGINYVGDVRTPHIVGDGEGRYYVILKDRKGGDISEWGSGEWPREFPTPRIA